MKWKRVRGPGREKVMKKLTVGLLVLLVCPVPAQAGATKAEKQAIKRAIQIYPPSFSVPLSQSDEAWARVIAWVDTVSPFPIDVQTDSKLQTYRPTDPGALGLYCTVERTESFEKVDFTANCKVANPFTAGTGWRGTAMLVRYVLTGDPDCLADDDMWSRKASTKCLIECSQDRASCEVKALIFDLEKEAQRAATAPFKIRIDLEEDESFLLEDDVQAAIDAGKAKKKFRNIGLNLWDPWGYDNHSVWIYTPRAWVELQSWQAKRNKREVSLTEEDVRPVLHVNVVPRIVPGESSPDGSRCPPLRAVVLKDESLTRELRPESEETQTLHVRSRQEWGVYPCVGILATFSLPEVEALRAVSPDAEFLVSVALGSDEAPYERVWRVEMWQFKDLP